MGSRSETWQRACRVPSVRWKIQLFFDRAEAHRAYRTLLDRGRISEQRLERLRADYEHFKRNNDDLYWSKRQTEKSSEMVVRSASVHVQEAGLKQVEANLQHYLDRQGPEGRGRGRAAATNVSEGNMDSMVKESSRHQESSTSVKRSKPNRVREPMVARDADRFADAEGTTEGLGFEDSHPTDNSEELQEIQDAIASAKSPFLPLLEYIYKRVQGQDAKLPPVPSSFLCQEYKELYEYAHDRILSKAKERAKDKTRAYQVDKDVLVALSGIVNTISPSTKAFSFTSAAKSESLVTSLDEKDAALTQLMDELLEAYCPGYEEDPLVPLDFWALRLKIWSQLAGLGGTSHTTRPMRQRMAVLQVVDHICTLISTNQLAPPTTEHVVVSAWSFILGVLLGGQVVRGVPGELASSAAKNVRLHVEGAYGVTTKFLRGRKVDISVRVFTNNGWDNEICIYEFKTGNASNTICANQQRKAVRLNTAVLHDLEYQGVNICQHFPIIAEGRGLCLSFYTLKRTGEVMTAGKSTNGVAWIPSDIIQLKQFFKSNSMHILLKFADHTARYAAYVQDTLSFRPQPSLPSTPPPRFKKPFVALTPQKHNKRKSMEDADEDDEEECV